MGGLCNCFISNPNEIIILDKEIEQEKRRAFKQSPMSLEDEHTTPMKKESLMHTHNVSSNQNEGTGRACYHNQIRKGFTKQDSLDSTINQKDITYALLAELNEARTDPAQYSAKVLKYSSYVKSTNRGECYFEFNKQRIILDQGHQVFSDCIDFLKETDPIPSLKMASDLIIAVPFDQINECDKPQYITKAMALKREELKGKYSHLEFQLHKNINHSEISALIQIIDPNDLKQSSRRNIFNEQFTHVGINSFEIDDNVFCYYILFGALSKDYDGYDDDHDVL